VNGTTRGIGIYLFCQTSLVKDTKFAIVGWGYTGLFPQSAIRMIDTFLSMLARERLIILFGGSAIPKKQSLAHYNTTTWLDKWRLTQIYQSGVTIIHFV